MTMDIVIKSSKNSLAFKFVCEKQSKVQQSWARNDQLTPRINIVPRNNKNSALNSAYAQIQEICEKDAALKLQELKEIDDIVYLYKVKPGAIAQSFALAAAKKTGLSSEISKLFLEFFDEEQKAFGEMGSEKEDDKIAQILLNISKINAS